MRIAVLGDIHGNLEALLAVLRAAREAGCDRVLHTGDLVGYGPWPNETIDLIRAQGISGVRGNFDENAAWGGESPGAAGDETEVTLAEQAYQWTLSRLGFGQRNFLKDMPFALDEMIGTRHLSVFHASPTDLYTAIDESAPDASLRAIAAETGADIHVFGHTHRPVHRIADGKHFINAGSVGLAGGGDPRACLAIVDINGRVTVDLRRVPYDSGKAASDAEHAGLPAGIVHRLRTGL